MNKMNIFFQIFTKSIFKPRIIMDLIEERSQIQEDQNHKNHEYKYDYNSIENFLLVLFRMKENAVYPKTVFYRVNCFLHTRIVTRGIHSQMQWVIRV